ncbi:hypothetical protein [Halomonas elongata]|uniref:hypothetical protein n=1 Tax=Halomonas elongata TaxID=2746 RepID=UPI004033C4D8
MKSKDLEKRLSDLSVQQVNDHLTRKDSEHACEACGTRDWRIHASELEGLVFLELPIFGMGGIGVPYCFLPLFCGNCGNTRLISANMMLDEIDEHEASSQD